MRTLVIGGGGREHAIIWKLAQSKSCREIFCAPGNGGISDLAECIDISSTDITEMIKFAKSNNIELTVVAPDDPLALGMVNAFEENGLRAFGPRKEAAIIESSKVFAKQLMCDYDIKTPNFRAFSNTSEALRYLNTAEFPIVIKAEGLALGKGVIIAENLESAGTAVINILDKRIFGDSGSKIVIESFERGNEVSILVFTDGITVKTMVSAQDHKKVFDGNKGPNTGGMGAFSPSTYYTAKIENVVMEQIILPTIRAMKMENRVFKGVLYFGLMLTEIGPVVLEYNARFGDPETQAILPLLKTDLFEIFNSIIDNELSNINLEWEKKSSACVILASEGYPSEYKKGLEIFGLDEVKKIDGINVFHSGTKKVNGKYYTNGGRVLGINAMDQSLDKALSKIYNATEIINFSGMHFRKDIGTVSECQSMC